MWQGVPPPALPFRIFPKDAGAKPQFIEKGLFSGICPTPCTPLRGHPLLFPSALVFCARASSTACATAAGVPDASTRKLL